MASKSNRSETWYLLGVAVVVALVLSLGWLQYSNRPPEPFEALADSPETSEVTSGAPLFLDKTPNVGVSFTPKNGEEADNFAILEAPGCGVALFDFDGDGLVDVFFTGGGYFDGPDKQQIKGHPNGLFKNLGHWKFRDVTQDMGLDKPLFYSHGCAVADFNNDGWPDLLVTGWGQVALYQNKQGKGFEEVSAKAGLPKGLWTTSAAWGDLDGDGYPDLYLCQYVNWSFANNPICPGYGLRGGVAIDVCPPRPFQGLPHKVLRNKGDGTFEDVSATCGLRKETANDNKGLGVIMVDVNGDRKPDIYVANDVTPNLLYINRSTPGKILLEEMGLTAGVATDDQGQNNGSMGTNAADIDGSGRPSLFVTNYEGELHALYRNEDPIKRGGKAGDVRFTHQSNQSGLGMLGKLNVGWGAVFFDLDNDGMEDLAFAQGHAIRVPEVLFPQAGAESPTKRAKLKQRAGLMRNLGNGQFQKVGGAGGAYFISPHRGRGLAVGDLDNDGKADLIFSNINETTAFLQNNDLEGNRWLGFELEGKGHRDLVGAAITLEVDGKTFTRFVKGGGSYLSSSDPRPLFGIKKSSKVIGKLTVFWPTGEPKQQQWEGLPLDRYHKLIQGEAKAATPTGAKKSNR